MVFSHFLEGSVCMTGLKAHSTVARTTVPALAADMHVARPFFTAGRDVHQIHVTVLLSFEPLHVTNARVSKFSRLRSRARSTTPTRL